jgi:hypothetical protein
VKGFRIGRPTAAQWREARINGTSATLQSAGDFVQWGETATPPRPAAKTGAAEATNGKPATSANEPVDRGPEHTAALHCWFSPEEVHLSPGDQREIRMWFRCVGDGQVQGRLRVSAPTGLRVEPEQIAIESLGEGQQRTVKLKVHAATDAAKTLHVIRFLPEDGLGAAPTELLASVGVVITEDRRLPMNAQFVVRAPGYTMKVDHTSGVSYCLLDGEGHRRHGRIHNTNFIHGIPAVEQEGKWAYHFGMPCAFIWPGENTLTIGCGTGAIFSHLNVRIRYTFHEDRIVIGVVSPTNPTKQQTMWLGNFDALEPPRHNGKQGAPHEPIVADRFFFPHPVYRQGLLLATPAQTPLRFLGTAVNFPIRLDQEVVLQFVEESEAGLK